MAKKDSKKNGGWRSYSGVSSRARRVILALLCGVAAIFFVLAWINAAGPAGGAAYQALYGALGNGYFIAPIGLLILGVAALHGEVSGATPIRLAAVALLFIASLGLLDVTAHSGGVAGSLVGESILHFFGIWAGALMLVGAALVGAVIVLEDLFAPERMSILLQMVSSIARTIRGFLHRESLEENEDMRDQLSTGGESLYDERGTEESPPPVSAIASTSSAIPRSPTDSRSSFVLRARAADYKAPPLSLLERDRGKPGVGDIKANANIIKRTLQNFGIVVELDEISIGPSVTRYAIKPAEGVRLQRIVSLQNNLELALAASPVRIEAPIPGKSLVGIEVPNTSKMTVGLGTMLGTADFSSSGKPLLIALGRDITGGSHFANLARMPHLLIAGATGSGKSVSIHSALTSLIYRNAPANLRLIMIDPKRVELTLYRPLPHLLAPVITDARRAIMALRWAGKEMARRYDILETARVRDIESYHHNILAPQLEKLQKDAASEAPDPMPYIVIVIDELADIMQAFPRELEAAIVRLAQMSRAVGIHLVLSTQRPSVNVITGLIKANIPARIALQVASQIDSRTIIDMAGAEKLLGAGDMLYLSGDMGKPVRLQSAFISEEEVKRVADWVGKNNEAELPVDIGGSGQSVGSISEGGPAFSSSYGGQARLGSSGSNFGDEEEVDDDMYEAAHQAVMEAGKASTSYIQRKLRVGYARAARLMDMLEERGIIGPADGAKPREVLGATKSPGANDAADS